MDSKSPKTPDKTHQEMRNICDVDLMADCDLPQDILMSILLLLPVKSLSRFKGVCKPWRSLITDPRFVKMHYSHFSEGESPKANLRGNFQVLNCRDAGLVPPGRSDRFDLDISVNFVLLSVKGLICMGWPLVTDRILLWNPTTRLSKVLPRSSTSTAGDPIPSRVSLGLGCNEEGDDYKVVRITCMNGDTMPNCAEVYSSKSDSWARVGVRSGFRTFPVNGGHLTVVNGNPHWLVCTIAQQAHVLRFDATKMVFTMIDLPERGSLAFVDWGGCLGRLECVEVDGSIERIEVMVYGADREWRKLPRVFEAGLRGLQVRSCLGYNPRKGKIVGRCRNGDLFEYDVKEGSGRVHAMGRGDGFLRLMVVHVLVHEDTMAYVSGMEPMDLTESMPDDDRIADYVIDGFFTCVVTTGLEPKVEFFYPLTS